MVSPGDRDYSDCLLRGIQQGYLANRVFASCVESEGDARHPVLAFYKKVPSDETRNVQATITIIDELEL